MKKILLIAALVLGFAAVASAQPRAIGIRGGYGVELSYQHTLGSENFLEADLGLAGTSFNLAGIYNFHLTEFGEGFKVYGGPGAAVGMGAGHFNLGIAGQLGIEYTFNFPLQLSLDLRPQLGLGFISGAADSDSASDARSIIKFTCWGWYPSLGIRYAF